VFVLVPPNFDPSPDFREARTTAATLSSALDAARPGKVVYLSTIGAQATHSNLLSQHTIIEQALRELSLPIAFLRPGWFMENSAWDVASVTRNGVIPIFLRPPGPHRVTANEIAAAFANLLGRPVRVEVVPRETRESLFKSQGTRNPTPRIQTLDGFNEGRIEFQGGHAGPRKGNVTLETVLRTLIERESKL